MDTIFKSVLLLTFKVALTVLSIKVIIYLTYYNQYLQLIKITDIEQSDTIWSFIVKTSSTGNPIISEVDFKSILGIPDINNNLDVANNNHNLKKKCEWAKSCGLTWDVVDKMC